MSLLAVGDELLEGRTADTNSAWLGGRLFDLGFHVIGSHVIPDDEELLAETITTAAQASDLVISTGGLGPTLDDLTREAAARAAGLELVRNAEAFAELQRSFSAAGREVTRSNERQANLPRGAELIPNAYGTAPGFALDIAGARFVALPGPPREMAGVFADELRPRLEAFPGRPEIHTAEVHTCGLPESTFAELVGDWMERKSDPRMGVTAKGGVLSIVIHAGGVGATERVEERRRELVERLGEHVFAPGLGSPTADLARVAGELLIESGTRVALAESCTGGLVAARLTEVPGISAVLGASFVTYSNESKADLLGVPEELIEEHGAVSEEVVQAMAAGAAERSGAQLAVSVSGIAGPGGGSPEKPVGTVWFGLWHRGRLSSVVRRYPDRGRDFVRMLAVTQALDMIRRELQPGL